MLDVEADVEIWPVVEVGRGDELTPEDATGLNDEVRAEDEVAAEEAAEDEADETAGGQTPKSDWHPLPQYESVLPQ